MTILASEVAVVPVAAPPNQAGPGSYSSRHIPSFRNQFMSSSNPFRGKENEKGSSDPALQSQYHKQLDHPVIDFLAVLEEFRRPFEVSFQLYVRVSLLSALGL